MKDKIKKIIQSAISPDIYMLIGEKEKSELVNRIKSFVRQQIYRVPKNKKIYSTVKLNGLIEKLSSGDVDQCTIDILLRILENLKNKDQ